MKTLAVVVLNWNGLDDTRALLPTLARCRVPEGWSVRLVVVDNDSSDGSVSALGREFPEVEVLAQPENRRFAGGCNAGLRRALDEGADAVMLLNNDTEADPGLVEKLLLALAEEPRAGAASPLICFKQPLDVIWYAGGRCVPRRLLSFEAACAAGDPQCSARGPLTSTPSADPRRASSVSPTWERSRPDNRAGCDSGRSSPGGSSRPG